MCKKSAASECATSGHQSSEIKLFRNKALPRIFLGLDLSQTPIYIYTSGCVLCGPESLWRGCCTDVQDLTPQIYHMRASDRTEKDLQVQCFLNLDCQVGCSFTIESVQAQGLSDQLTQTNKSIQISALDKIK